MIVVVDTNILVSGLLSPLGASAKIVERLARGLLHACYDQRILSEYREVLLRPRFGFDARAIDTILEKIAAEGVSAVCLPLAASLPDADDNMFVEAALAGSARCVVTGNLRHYPADRCCGVVIATPAHFVKWPDFP